MKMLSLALDNLVLNGGVNHVESISIILKGNVNVWMGILLQEMGVLVKRLLRSIWSRMIWIRLLKLLIIRFRSPLRQCNRKSFQIRLSIIIIRSL